MNHLINWQSKNGIDAETLFERDITGLLKTLTNQKSLMIKTRRLIHSSCSEGYEHTKEQEYYEFLPLTEIWRHIPIPVGVKGVKIEIIEGMVESKIIK